MIKKPWTTVLFVVLLALIPLGILFARHRPGPSSDWAAWVQAVGSILAIIGATFIASWQTTRAENAAKELRRQDAIAKFYSIRALFLQSCAVFQIGINVAKKDYKRSYWQTLIADIDSISDRFNSLPILELPGTQTGSRISLNLQNLRSLRATCVHVLENDDFIKSNERDEILEKFMKRCETHFDWVAIRILEISDRQEFIHEMGEDIYQRTLKLRADEELRGHPLV